VLVREPRPWAFAVALPRRYVVSVLPMRILFVMARMKRTASEIVGKISEQPDVQTGTALSPHLLAEARLAVVRAQLANSAGRWQDELGPTLAAILCAHAAVEAAVNDEANRLDSVWFTANERLPLEEKWSRVVKQRTGQPPQNAGGPRQSLLRLDNDRNLIAHFKGVPQSNGRVSVTGPPVRRRGGISRVRSYFGAVRAERALADAESAIAAVRP
jgi:hypothetical protein